MKLADYLDAVSNGNTQWPEDLTLPGEMHDAFENLYKDAEKAGVEHGQFLLYDGHGNFNYGDVATGYKDHMDIPSSTDPECFGNVHAHPSESIGHNGGYSAHSIPDLMHFADTAARDIFIQFVTSGPMVYAMVYIKGHSSWNAEVAGYLNAAALDDLDAARTPFFPRFKGRDGFNKALMKAGEDGDVAAAEAFLDGLKKDLPEYGKHLQHISIDNCKGFAERWDYRFFIWKDRILTPGTDLIPALGTATKSCCDGCCIIV